LIEQREIEARIVGPLVLAFADEFGREKTLEIVRGVIVELARTRGRQLAEDLGQTTLDAFASTLELWKQNDALSIEMLEQTPERLSFNVTRCRYAELYRTLGLAELGATLSCQRDFSLAEGFNPDFRLTRTQTIMEGAAHCDFRFRSQQRSGQEADPRESAPDAPIEGDR
jgi:hypothetical protein